MGQLIVRSLEDEVIEALKKRAKANGRSAEAEHREILRQALQKGHSNDSFWEYLKAMPDLGDDADFERQRDYPREVKF